MNKINHQRQQQKGTNFCYVKVVKKGVGGWETPLRELAALRQTP